MDHSTAKQLLEQAKSFSERIQAVEAALAEGMPLIEIEAYLDWLDSLRPPGSELSLEEDDEAKP